MITSQPEVVLIPEEIFGLQEKFLSSKSLTERKNLGQFFTSLKVSGYMASLVSLPLEGTIRILDAGAGTGILTASTALHCLKLGVTSVHATLYEIDSGVIKELTETMELVKKAFNKCQASFNYTIHTADFVLARPDMKTELDYFDVSVINPPYFKYSANDSPYAQVCSDLYRGDPNIYASFMATVLACMKRGGQMVTITPRSFTNGLYFKGFRSYLLKKSSLELIHVFKYRDKLFNNKNSSVLQENIICKFVKEGSCENIVVRTSDCDDQINNSEEHNYKRDFIIDNSSELNLIRIPESLAESEILEIAERLPTTFESAGYFISTGRVVEHRTKEYISDEIASCNSVPLYLPHNITPPIIQWSGEHKKDVLFNLSKGHDKHTVRNQNYVLLKRFSSKDEKRRLVAGVHLAENQKVDFMGFGNKTNYIGLKGQELPIIEAYGIVTVFNSTFMDRYFRCISGNTQVNATEIRVMRFPSREQIKQIGEMTLKSKMYNIEKIDRIMFSVLRLNDKK